jgi:poly-gamma-glutamate synthesis protein (capsule biosynthesis protein)
MSPDRQVDRVRLFLAGDVMTGRGIDQVLPHPGDPTLHEDFVRSALDYVALAEAASGPVPRGAAPAYVWGDLLHDLARRRPDLRLVNLETAITTCGAFEPKGINYRMHPSNVDVLSAAAIDACGLANNHVLDWGEDGLVETLEILDAAGIGHAGAGRTAAEALRPLGLDAGNARVLVAAFGCVSSGIPAGWKAGAGRPGVALLPEDVEEAVAAVSGVASARSPGELLVVSLHWGGNWGLAVPERQRRLAHRLIEDVGVDLVWGHSSHHPKAGEVHRGRLILYGCGDLLNDYEGIAGHEEHRPRLALAHLVDLDSRTGALLGLEMVPYRLSRLRLGRAPAGDAEWLASRLDREFRQFGGRLVLSDDMALCLFPSSGATAFGN